MIGEKKKKKELKGLKEDTRRYIKKKMQVRSAPYSSCMGLKKQPALKTPFVENAKKEALNSINTS